jgi:hypothetical protein
MFPQLVQPDSAKKSSDILPFAPFINTEQVKKNQALQKKDTLKVSLKIKSQAVAKKDTLQKKLIVQPVVAQKKDSVVKQNISQPIATVDTSHSDTAQLTKAENPQDIFRFNDDTTAAANVTSEKIYTTSEKYFSPNLLKINSTNPSSYSQPVPDWFTFFFILTLVGITAIRVFYQKIFSQIFAAFLSLAVTNQVVRDENILVQRATVLLNIIFYGIAALFLYLVSVHFNWNHPFINEGIFRFFIFAIMIACFYSVKMIILKVLSIILEVDKPVSIYIFSIFLINNVVGLILLPMIAILAYVSFQFSGVLFILCLGVSVAGFIYCMTRAFNIALSLPRVSLYYLFLYFCTLEIAPVLLILKATGNFR